MKLLEEKIKADGKIYEGDILKVDSFVNHRIDVGLMNELGKEFYRRFASDGVNKILTIEASGIGIACLAAQYFGAPVVFAKKSRTSNLAPDVYTAKVVSYTHGNTNNILVSKDYLTASDRVLIIDDFLATGEALFGLADLVAQAGATLVGAGILIEKAYQAGGKRAREQGIRVESLARIASMNPTDGITFIEE